MSQLRELLNAFQEVSKKKERARFVAPKEVGVSKNPMVAPSQEGAVINTKVVKSTKSVNGPSNQLGREEKEEIVIEPEIAQSTQSGTGSGTGSLREPVSKPVNTPIHGPLSKETMEAGLEKLKVKGLADSVEAFGKSLPRFIDSTNAPKSQQNNGFNKVANLFILLAIGGFFLVGTIKDPITPKSFIGYAIIFLGIAGVIGLIALKMKSR